MEEAAEALEEARQISPDDPQIKRQLLQLEMKDMVSGDGDSSATGSADDSASEDAVQ